MKLSVNVDHVATLRQARGGVEPDPITAALLAEQAGASGIIVHLREDRRHIQDHDVKLLRQLIKTKLILEMAPVDAMVKFAMSIRPDMVTLVPERRQELTTEGGLDVIANREVVTAVVNLLQDGGIPVCIFINTDPNQIEAAHKTQAKLVELHTGEYANAKSESLKQMELEKLEAAAVMAHKLGLRVNAGHGLDYHNVVPIAKLPYIEELNIGHSIISRAVFVGIKEAVRQMLQLIHR